jgi:tetratricopeptide (TPR) repeat protein
MVIDAERLAQRLEDPAVAALARTADVTSASHLLSLLLQAGDGLERWLGDAAPNTDDRPTLEYLAPRLLYEDPMAELFEGLHTGDGGVNGAVLAPPDVAARLPDWRRARLFESRGRLALREGRGEEALAQLGQAYAILPDAPSIRRTLAGTLSQRGAALARRGEMQGAFESLDSALRVDPDLPETYVALGRMILRGGSITTALEMTEDGLSRIPDAADLHVLRAEVLLRMRRFEEAAASAERGLELSPRHLEGHTALADALERLGRTAEAESVLVAGLAIHPGAESLESRRLKLRRQDP